jgi:hypothetical protein
LYDRLDSRDEALPMEKVYLETSFVMTPNSNSNEPWRDPIVEEVRRIRSELDARFNFNVRAIVEDAMKREKTGGREVVSFVKEKSSMKTNRLLG